LGKKTKYGVNIAGIIIIGRSIEIVWKISKRMTHREVR
jgi:hypothetical protein